MKYIKKYENINLPNYNINLPIGEFVICQRDFNNTKIKNYINNNIGIIVYSHKATNIYYQTYFVKYDNIPNDVWKGNNLEFIVSNSEIKHHSSNINDLKIILTTNKYNI
jgi:hypothetical protein